MTEDTSRRSHRRADAVLALVALALGTAVAAGYGAWRAVSLEDASSSARWTEFGDAMVIPGLLIIVAVAAMVWFGWKANID
jgi:hypothetical protein